MNAEVLGPQTLGELVGTYLATQCTVIVEAEEPLRAGHNVIHPTRVAVRRLRSTLRVFSELFELPRASRLDEELRWYAAVLGEIRDLDVMERRLNAQLDGLPDEVVLGPVRSTLAEVVAGRRHGARQALLEAMDSERYRALVDLLLQWRERPPYTAEAERPAKRAGRYIKRADRRVSRRLVPAYAAAQAGQPEAGELLHAARKAGKRHRYAVEAAEPIWGSKATAIVERRKDFQELLGDHHDTVVAAAFLRELAASTGSAAGHNGFTWGVLYAIELADAEKTLAKVKDFL